MCNLWMALDNLFLSSQWERGLLIYAAKLSRRGLAEKIFCLFAFACNPMALHHHFHQSGFGFIFSLSLFTRKYTSLSRAFRSPSSWSLGYHLKSMSLVSGEGKKQTREWEKNRWWCKFTWTCLLIIIIIIIVIRDARVNSFTIFGHPHHHAYPSVDWLCVFFSWFKNFNKKNEG